MEGITLGASDELDEVAGEACGMGVDRIGEIGDRANEGQAAVVYGACFIVGSLLWKEARGANLNVQNFCARRNTMVKCKTFIQIPFVCSILRQYSMQRFLHPSSQKLQLSNPIRINLPLFSTVAPTTKYQNLLRRY